MAVDLAVTNLNDTAPVATADTATTPEDTAVTIDVLANDGDADGDTPSIASASVPVEQGTVAIVAGRLVFTPASDFNGTATITYAISDGTHTSAPGTVTVTVTPVNDVPVVQDDARTTAENTAFTTRVPLATDADAPPEVQETGAVDYTVTNRTFSFFGPENGSAEFGVVIGSGPGGFASIGDMVAAFQAHPNYGQLPYTIGVNTAGDGLRLSFKTIGDFGTRGLERWGDGAAWLGTVRAGQDVTYSVASDVPAGQGTLSFNADGSYTFNPGADFDDLAAGQSRSTSFTYTATDASSASAVAKTVTITVTGVNDAPTLDLDADDSAGAEIGRASCRARVSIRV